MAKKRTLARRTSKANATTENSSQRGVLDVSLIAACFLGGTFVYVLYHPSDAAAVESGDALWFCLLSLVTGLLVGLWKTIDRRSMVAIDPLDASALALAGWIGIAALGTSGVGNLRAATNEAWVWVAGAVLLISMRPLAAHLGLRRAILGLLVTGATGLAVHGLHQELVTLPMNRAAFEQDPDGVIEQAGLDAPGGSAERAIFAGRLYDGGPTGTFALANSLAAWLLAGVLLASGLLVFQWRESSRWQLFVVLICLLICAVALLATRSRSGVVAAAIGIGWIIGFARRTTPSAGDEESEIAPSKSTLRRTIIVASLTVLFVGAIGFARPALLVVPSSLAFRFQYWNATLRMAIDRPWFGAGPGNFQAIYQQYRDWQAAEQIADPHNFLMETLGSGGWIGLALLAAALLVGTRQAFARNRRQTTGSDPETGDHASAVWIGAIIAWAMVWLFGFATRRLPDLDASLYVVPIAAATAFFIWPTINRLPAVAADRMATVVVGMLLLHLTVSGGWTVPGIAILVWATAGIVTRVGDGKESPLPAPAAMDATLTDQPWSGRSLAMLVGCGILTILLYVLSIRPVTAAKQQLEIAHQAIETRRLGQSRAALEAAAASDRWSPIPPLMLADQYRWRLVAKDSVAARQTWRSALDQARDLAGQDPTLMRAIGTQQLHLYQRYGRSADLSAARQTFEQAVEWSPADQWLTAQLAVIVAASNDRTRFQRLTERARGLSKLGINTERRLPFQQIYPARLLGSSTLAGPIRRSAELELDELSKQVSRSSDNNQPDR